ncbi:tetratricopeptide repeat protein [Kitasatospora sp. SUK 42]|nr:tetratricopeptide repeat protein [Kitasatospora sp. SUK 42]
MTGAGGAGSGYAVGGRLVLSSAHVTGPAGTRVEVFHPGGPSAVGATVVWAGTPKERDDAALLLVDDSPDWHPPTTPVGWGLLVTNRPGTACETWGMPDEAQRPGRDTEASHLGGQVNPGSGFVNYQYVMDLAQPPPQEAAAGTSPWGGLSGAAVFSGRLLIGVVAADRSRSAHGRLNVVPSYVLHHDEAFRAALAEHGAGAGGGSGAGGGGGIGPGAGAGTVAGLGAVEFQGLADPAHDHAGRRRPATPAALLEAGRQVVPFHGRTELLDELRAWCGLGGFGAWLLHGPGGQGKTRLAHHLSGLLAAEGWAVLWPRTDAGAAQLREVRHAGRRLLVVLDYAETRTDQLTALVEAAAEHPGTSALKFLLLARTDGDWWLDATTRSRLAESHLAGARSHRLTPLEDDAGQRPARYREIVRALAAALPLVDGLAGHDWSTPPPARGLDEDAYGNALTLHMTALADLLDMADPVRAAHDEAHTVEDRLLGHERRYWRQNATIRGLIPTLGAATLETALAAAHLTGATDREDADRLWQRLPALADQPRTVRDQVTAWLAALYPAGPELGGQPWGHLQPDRLAERHIGRVLEADPHLAEHLLDDADDSQAGQLLTVYSRTAAHPVFQQRLAERLTDLCVRHQQQLAPHVIKTAIRADHPAPLVSALDAVVAEPTTPLNGLKALQDLFPHSSRRLAATAVKLGRALVDRHRALVGENSSGYLSDLAMALNNLSVCLSEVGQREEALAISRDATGHYRTLADANPDAHLPNLAMALNNLSVNLADLGRREEALAISRDATDRYRTLADANPDAHLPNLAKSLNNHSNRLSAVGQRDDALTASQEATNHYRTLADANPDAHLPNLAMALNTLSIRLGEAGQREEALATSQEATNHNRTLAKANPDAYLPDLAAFLNNLSNRLGEAGQREEALATSQEATNHNRTLADANPDAYLPNFAASLITLSVRLGEAGQREEALATSQEATNHYRKLARAYPELFKAELQKTQNVAAWLETLEP